MLAVVHQQIEDAVLCSSPVGIYYRKDGETTGAEQNWVKLLQMLFLLLFLQHLFYTVQTAIWVEFVKSQLYWPGKFRDKESDSGIQWLSVCLHKVQTYRASTLRLKHSRDMQT